ncbi:MAG TPA: DNA cytosine methyltransferase [Pseudobdellovibrionaceae bacterium]|nr:DNA cytosine methyltransferase [Pseudobdellovibrionaceae bacterium]
MRVLELCAGGGGQALGLDLAGYETAALVEIEKEACATLSHNRPEWNVVQADLKILKPDTFKNIDLICGGVPCQPFSIAGQKLGQTDERDLFPVAINYVQKLKPVAFFFENVRGLASGSFEGYRDQIVNEFIKAGYYVEWRVLEASDYGVPQLRPRFVLVGKRNGAIPFPWPVKTDQRVTVAQTISDQMGKYGWKGLEQWMKKADHIAPTIVGGSKKHGGPDLGPTRAKRQWASLGVDGMGIANDSPAKDFEGLPRLTNEMVARLQGFPDSWKFMGKKTAVYRQIGNAFPPPVAKAVAEAMRTWVSTSSKTKSKIKPVQLDLVGGL